MAAPIVLTAPKAFIQIDYQTVGYVRNLSFSENITRANVQGLGSLTLQEAPAVLYTCQWSVSQYFISFSSKGMKKMLMKYGSAENLKNSLIVGDISFSLVIYEKIKGTSDDLGLVTSLAKEKTVISLNQCVVNTQSFQLQEGGIAGIDVTGIYLEPVTDL